MAHDLGDIVDLNASFQTSSGSADPTAMRYRVWRPAILAGHWQPLAPGILTTYTTASTAVSRLSTSTGSTADGPGRFVLQLPINVADRYNPTTWFWEAQSSGTAVAGGSTSFVVNPTRFGT